ncbi:MAG TPA: hypothetical protein VF600_14890 [Abditibacteriaceae bacterium]|jgi:hypothetical protein
MINLFRANSDSPQGPHHNQQKLNKMLIAILWPHRQAAEYSLCHTANLRPEHQRLS